MFKTNTDLQNEGGSALYDWLLRNFYVEYLTSVRREMESGGGFLTLVNFLRELEQYCEGVLTRKRYVALYAGGPLEQHGIPDKDFDMKVGAMCRYPRTTPEEDCISADSVRHARLQLEKDVEKVVNFANWFIAHRTRKTAFKLTLADMYKAMNRIFDTYARYYKIITAGTWRGKFPTPQYDWQKPFTVPWITEDFGEFEPPD